jgi:hypothetical protein
MVEMTIALGDHKLDMVVGQGTIPMMIPNGLGADLPLPLGLCDLLA